MDNTRTPSPETPVSGDERQSSDLVKRVAMAMNPLVFERELHPDAMSLDMTLEAAKCALEASHHAELVARNAKLRDELFRSNEEACELAVALRKLRRLVAMYVEDAPALQETDALLAKIGGEA